jgi:hypothetical protein
MIRVIKSRRMGWVGHVERMGQHRYAYKILVEKPEGKRPQVSRRRKWVDDIKMNIRKIGWGGMDGIDLVHDRNQWRALVNTVMNIRVP